MCVTLREKAETVLRSLAGETARLRDDQWTAIEALVSEHRRVLCVQRTGWGKSAIYFVATALLRANGSGPTLIVSPLLALMRNQIQAATRAGIAARTINSSNLAEWNDVYDEILDGRIDALLVSPERLTHPDFRDYILPKLAEATGLVVIDEAHCISDWGHDFRPDYRRIRSLLDGLAPLTPVLATTATANTRVVADIADQLGRTLVLRGALDRASLHLAVVSLPSSAHRLAWLADHLNELPGSGIIYSLTVGGAEQAAAFLRARGHSVLAYSSNNEDGERRIAEDDLVNNHLKALVATSALGMGFDKADLGFVVHLGAPPSPIAYYQQIGRAGRAIDNATIVLLPSDQDLPIWRYFAMLAFPPEKQVRAVLSALGRAGHPLSIPSLETRVDLSRGRLEHMLKVLDVDGAVRKVEGGWVSTGQLWLHDTERFERVSAARENEQTTMLAYIATTGCRLEYLRRVLDDPEAGPCGRCDNCTGSFMKAEVSDDSLQALRRFIDSPGVEIKPRSIWPSGLQAIGIPLNGRIPISEVALTGCAIARMTDIGWGEEIRLFLSNCGPDTTLPDRLLNRSLKVLSDWVEANDLHLEGVVAIESRRRPALINGLAVAIALKMDIPLLGALKYCDGAAEPRQSNSARQVASLYSAFTVSSEPYDPKREQRGTVLLVDDFVDSGWTMTLAARVLRRAGTAAVVPFALATVVGRD